jgi:hypothetical protein
MLALNEVLQFLDHTKSMFASALNQVNVSDSRPDLPPTLIARNEDMLNKLDLHDTRTQLVKYTTFFAHLGIFWWVCIIT